jgi:simple sugar transport system permease protein
VLYDSASNSPKVPGFGLEVASPIVRVLADPVVLLLALVFGAVSTMLVRTRFGLHLRASGEGPDAARAAGVDVASVRIAASTLAGAIAAIGGAHLVFDQHHFDAGMSGGRGFIALAAVILGGWRPGRAALACLGFAALEATQIALQDAVKVPPELVQMLPYAATLVVLGLAKGARAPAGIGRP